MKLVEASGVNYGLKNLCMREYLRSDHDGHKMRKQGEESRVGGREKMSDGAD